MNVKKDKIGRKKSAVINSMIGLVTSIISMTIAFVTRSIFIKYLGVELLGISSTFTSVLGTISLAELGFQTAIIYYLYKPLSDENYTDVNELICILKVVYNIIGVLFIIVGICLIPSLPVILKGINVDGHIIVYYLIHILNASCTYFLGYRRTLLYADKREYTIKTVDSIISIVFCIMKIIAVIMTANYLIYIVLTTIQTITSNIVLHILCKRYYRYLVDVKFNVVKFESIWKDIKVLFVGKIAGYIYGSTDNIIISSVIGAVSVGYIVNYTTVINAISTLVFSVFSPIAPMIGNLIVEEHDKNRNEKIFRTYTYVRYSITLCSVIPFIVLAQSFIEIWVGSQYMLSMVIVWLFGIDRYINFVHSSLCDFINADGLFAQDKNIEIIGALTNIVISIILAHFIGIIGVLIGTIVSQGVFWIGRSAVVYQNCFKGTDGNYKMYWQQQALYFIIFIFLTVICEKIYDILPCYNYALRFVTGGIICEIFAISFNLLLFHKTYEYKFIKSTILEIIFKIKNV
ncbi:hypothetical protein BXO88_01350 [Oribacterium sp. C9]|uniref:lipopolysaccharide biosynthesis protein n=1 Tax=Oribacterium sp. C9 TaxID=1943579 RepID=UPI00098FFBD1|nr:oligosaccharide flippase family protein [Oribacterium sp. C9]OON88466.1 hypothetical protein BXO88_01350 [Oribacterium sp. C9]